MLLLGALAFLAAAPARGAPELVAESEAAFARGDFEHALQLLGEAELVVTDKKILGRVLSSRGLVEEVLQRPELATLAFVRALRCDGELNLDPGRQKRSVIQLFELARALARS